MADIGDKLRSAREEKGLSIADIERVTKIQARYLEAIEQNEFDKLPGDFYVRAFIRQYAQIVDLDGKELLDEYQHQIPEAEPEQYVEESIDNKSKEVQKTTSNKRAWWKTYLPRIIIGLAVIVVILGGYVLYAHGLSQKQPEDDAVTVSSQNEEPKKKPKKAKKNRVKFSAIGNNSFRVSGLKKNRHLVVRAGDQSIAVTITIDGNVFTRRTLVAEQKHSVNLPIGTQNVVVTFSNAQGTKISIGGKAVPYDDIAGALTLNFAFGKSGTSQANSSQTNNNQTNSQSNYQQNNSQTRQNHHQQNNDSDQQNDSQSGQNNANNSGDDQNSERSSNNDNR